MRRARRLGRLGAAWIAAPALFLAAAPARAQTGGYIGSVYFVSADNVEGERSDAMYLLNGFDVEKGRIRASATVPFIVQRIRWTEADGAAAETPWLSGFGDPFFRVDVAVWRPRARGSSFRLSASIKPPLASVTDGFSSGEVDYAFGASWSSWRGRQSVLADVTYWVVGDPPDTDLRNVPAFYVGYGRVLDSRYRWSAIVSASGSPPLAPGLGSTAQISAAVLRTVGRTGAAGVSVDVGLTGGAADIALGTTWRFAF